VQGNLATHIGLTGSSVHGLGTAATHAAGDFESAGAAATVAGNLATHAGLTTTAHGGIEPALGNPGVNGYVLSSTTVGVRSWVAPGGAAAFPVVALYPSANTTIATGYGAYIPCYFEIVDTYVLEIADNAIMEIG